MMKLFIQNASTDKVELNRWLVLNSDGGILGVFLGDICGSDGLTLLCANGLTFTNTQPELGLLEAQRHKAILDPLMLRSIKAATLVAALSFESLASATQPRSVAPLWP